MGGGYAKSTGLSYTAGRTPKQRRGDDWLRHDSSRANTTVGVSEFGDDTGSFDPQWLSRSEGDDVAVISEEGSTAQVWVWSLYQSSLKLSASLLTFLLQRPSTIMPISSQKLAWNEEFNCTSRQEQYP